MNKIYTHPGQDQMQVEVILASRGVNGAPPLYTIRMRYPRVIHSEIMTHRVFSRNARSSRAVPVKTMLLETTTIPFIPWHWGANQKGMQAGAECNELVSVRNILLDYDEENSFGVTHDKVSREAAWLMARDKSVEIAEAMMTSGYHKQIPNRLLEPFVWMDTLITATDWANFIHLRDHKDAEPHLQDLARLVKQAIEEAVVMELKEGEWHLPYITAADIIWACKECAENEGASEIDLLAPISAARNARISYAPFDGDPSYERELERYNQLVTSDRIHASPLEHIAQVDAKVRTQRMIAEDGFVYASTEVWANPNLSGNFQPGWIQFRKTVPGECFNG